MTPKWALALLLLTPSTPSESYLYIAAESTVWLAIVRFVTIEPLLSPCTASKNTLMLSTISLLISNSAVSGVGGLGCNLHTSGSNYSYRGLVSYTSENELLISSISLWSLRGVNMYLMYSWNFDSVDRIQQPLASDGRLICLSCT